MWGKSKKEIEKDNAFLSLRKFLNSYEAGVLVKDVIENLESCNQTMFSMIRIFSERGNNKEIVDDLFSEYCRRENPFRTFGSHYDVKDLENPEALEEFREYVELELRWLKKLKHTLHDCYEDVTEINFIKSLGNHIELINQKVLQPWKEEEKQKFINASTTHQEIAISNKKAELDSTKEIELLKQQFASEKLEKEIRVLELQKEIEQLKRERESLREEQLRALSDGK